MGRFERSRVVVVALCCLGLGGVAGAQGTAVPGLLDVPRLSFEIRSATFLTSLDGAGAEFNETQPEKYHGLVVTVRVTKSAGAELRLHPADFALHYRRASGDYDVAPCQGISSFSAVAGVDRTMTFFKAGWGSVATGTATRASDTVYVDLFFQNMEEDTRDLHLLVAQSVGARFATTGWATSAAPAADQEGLAGVWVDRSTGTRMTIVRQGTGYTVTSAVDDDGEAYPVSKVDWDGSVLRWTYDVPSTGYRVNWKTVARHGERLETEWSGSAGSGTENLRLVGGAPQAREVASGSEGRSLEGLGIRIIYVARRRADADEAARRLRALGAAVELFETSDVGNASHTGSLYVKAGHRQRGDTVIDAVRGLEKLRLRDGTRFGEGQQFNLWITR